MLERVFKLKANHTDIKTEVVDGISSFMANSTYCSFCRGYYFYSAVCHKCQGGNF